MSPRLPKGKPPRYSHQLNETLGPSPWYLRSVIIHGDVATWEYAPCDIAGSFPMCTTLRAGSERVVMVMGGCTYVRRIASEHVLLWTHAPAVRGTRPERLLLRRFDLRRLATIPDVDAACTSIANAHSSIVAGPAEGELDIPLRLADGVHDLAIPGWLTGVGELLILVDHPDAAWDRGGRRLWILRTSEHQLIVHSLGWFNEGDYDFGYQWLARVARDSRGRIVGDGVRISPFRLAGDDCSFDRWLRRNPFWTPR
jgi:hypothetical protein